MHEFYEKSDLFLVTSYNETFVFHYVRQCIIALFVLQAMLVGLLKLLPISMMAI